MKIFRKITPLLASKFLIMLVSVIFCSDMTEAKTYSWQEAVQTVSQNNPALNAALESYQASQSQSQASRSGYFPQLSGAMGYSTSTDYAASVITSGFTFSATATQNIFNGFSDLAKVRQAQANENIAFEALAIVKAQVGYNLFTSFENFYFAKKSLELSKEISVRRDTNLQLVKLRFNGGNENKGSVLLYQAYLKDAKFVELQNRNQILTAQVQLAQALGVDDESSLDIAGGVPIHEPEKKPNFSDLTVRTPVYKQAQNQEALSEASLTSARSGFYPTLGITGSVSKSGDWFPQDNRASFGVNLSIPLFNGGRDYYGTQVAVSNWHSALSTLKDTLHQVKYTLQHSYSAYLESVVQLEVNQSYLEAAVARAEIARASYKNGLTSFQDWDLAETDLIARERGVLASEQARVNAEATYLQALGQGVLP